MKIYKYILFTLILTACDSTAYKGYDVPIASSPEISSTNTPVKTIAPDEISPQKKIDIKSQLKPAYELGYQCGMKMLSECKTARQINESLLENRAREYSIRSQIGQEAAEAYLQGFYTSISESNDSLKSIIGFNAE